MAIKGNPFIAPRKAPPRVTPREYERRLREAGELEPDADASAVGVETNQEQTRNRTISKI